MNEKQRIPLSEGIAVVTGFPCKERVFPDLNDLVRHVFEAAGFVALHSFVATIISEQTRRYVVRLTIKFHVEPN
jgi:hypothetical protein